ncbi:MAG: NACHT domain-containing protein, partial [Cyanobacteria bacterium J06632_3]
MTQPPEPNEKLPVNEQIAEILLKVITTGGLAGGGAGAFWSLFKESDVPKAIASAVIGVGLAYGAKLLLPVHRGNERRLTKAGEAIDSGIDAGLGLITAGMIAAASRFDDKYLLCQALECQSFRSEGLAQQPGIFVPLLKEVFVLLALDLNASDPGYRSLSRNRQQFERQFEQQQFQNQSIWDFIKRAKQVPVFRQLAILAWGGYGKTTLLKHIAYLYGTKQTRPDVPKLIPVLLVLRTYKDLLAQDAPPSLPVLIEQHYIPRLAEAECLTVPDGWAQNLLTKGRALVMFDGFDEVAAADRPKVARWLNRQMRQYGKSMFVVTSRPKAYREQAPVDALGLTSSVWVKDFDSVQRQRFVERWYQCQERYAHGGRTTPDVAKIAGQAAKELLEQIEAELDLRALAKNPLLLNMITTFHRRYAGRDLPQRRVELYQEIVQLQLKDRPMMRKLKTRLSECEPETVLQEIAIAMMQGHAERVERDELFQFTQNILTNQGEMVLAQ